MKKVFKIIATVAGSFLFNWLKKKNVIKASSDEEAQLIALLDYYSVKFDYEQWQALLKKILLVLEDLQDIKEYFANPTAEQESNNMRLWLYCIRTLPVEDVIKAYLDAHCKEPEYMAAKQLFLNHTLEIVNKDRV